ncbi:MAG: glycosyl hydrolase family 20, partial [Hungatella sp.]
MVHHGIHLYHTMTELRNDNSLFKQEMIQLFEELDSIMKTHYRLWMARNRCGGFERSTKHMTYLLDFYNKSSKE